MPIGSVYPEPVQTESGYHVFRLGERRPVDFAAVREWVEKKALVQSRADDMERYIGTLRQRYQLALDADSARLYKAVDNLAGKQIMVAEARKLGIADDAAIRASVARERDALLVKRLYQAEAEQVGEIGDEAVRAFYDQHLDAFTRADGRVADFALVRESIRSALRQRAETEAMDALLAELHEEYRDQIHVFPAALEKAFD